MVGLIALLALLASMPVYAARARGRSPDPDLARRPASVLLGYWIRGWLVWVLSPVEGLLVRRRTSPLALNYTGLACAILAGAAFIAGKPSLAAWLIALGGVSDVLDGRIARARGLSSAHGAFMDSTLDRFAETVVFVGVAWYLGESRWAAAATVLALGGSLLVSYTRARGEALGITCREGLAQRAERLVILALASLLDVPANRALGWAPGTLLSAAVMIIGVGAVATAGHRAAVIARALAGRDVGPGPPRAGPPPVPGSEAAGPR